MPLWKQAAASLFVILAASLAWFWLYPGAADVLARTGLLASVDDAAAPASGAQGQQRRRRGPQQGPSVTEAVTQATINDHLAAIGTGRAVQSVTVNPLTSGTLTDILVKPGSRITAGEPVARLDSDAEAIAFDRAEIALEDARQKLERIMTLRSTNTVTKVQQTEAELALRNAELAKREAELALQRRTISAPIAGTVGILPISAGSYVTPATEIVTIDDRSRILIDFWVPERFATQIKVGAPVTASPVARGEIVQQGTVTAIDNRVDPVSRTLRVEAAIENDNDRLRAGMAFNISMRFAGDTHSAVPPLAIQWGSDGPFVWAVKDGMAAKTPVRIIQRNTDTVLVEGDLSVDDQVVTEGIHNMREGAPVNTAEGPAGRRNRAGSEDRS